MLFGRTELLSRATFFLSSFYTILFHFETILRCWLLPGFRDNSSLLAAAGIFVRILRCWLLPGFREHSSLLPAARISRAFVAGIFITFVKMPASQNGKNYFHYNFSLIEKYIFIILFRKPISG